MEKNQREYILRQQMDAIRKELGDESGEGIVEEYRKKIADANMPEGARAEAERELGRLEAMPEQSPEYGWIRTYLDWMTEIPGTSGPRTTSRSIRPARSSTRTTRVCRT